jgi:hypothetical protein
MSTTTRVMACAPEDVFAVLADGWTYANWVVGAVRIRDVDAHWPEPGSTLHHSVGLWPALLSDTTTVEELDAPNKLTLKVRAWPTGEGRVTVRCRRVEDGTEVVMEEQAVSGPAKKLPKAAQDAMLEVRNREALHRLAYICEGRARGNG